VAFSLLFSKMPIFSIQNRKLAGTVLVALQFGLLFGLAALASPKLLRVDLSLGALILAGVSIALAAWTLIHNPPGNFNIRPTPREKGTLITTGPYRHIRHPMYTSVLLGAAALAWLSDPLPGWSAWLALAFVLLSKSSLEEPWMCEQHPGYGTYMQTNKRLLPWIF
jgi:protein-S-isoprenylcysteine O-methyltransferase Ste14